VTFNDSFPHTSMGTSKISIFIVPPVPFDYPPVSENPSHHLYVSALQTFAIFMHFENILITPKINRM